jgi:hypothetical protein
MAQCCPELEFHAAQLKIANIPVSQLEATKILRAQLHLLANDD